MKFLIVDDDPAILKITEKLISLQGHEVVCCETALDAMKALSDFTYDILITDVTMPSHSGFDLIRSVRKNSEFSYLSIVTLTGRSEKRDITQALGLGIQDYIVKPLEPDLFMEKVEKLVERHKNKKIQKPRISKNHCQMMVPVRVVAMTPRGLNIESPYLLQKGTAVTINLPEFQEAGLLQNRFRAVFNSQDQSSN